MSVESIIDQLQDVQTAFDKLNEVYDNVNNQFSQARDLRRFQARKQEYKKIRDEAWWWLQSVGRTPTKRMVEYLKNKLKNQKPK